MTSQPSGVILKVLRHPLLYAALIIAAAAIEGGVPSSIGASPLASEAPPAAPASQDPAAH